jgi:hypothetical protein
MVQCKKRLRTKFKLQITKKKQQKVSELKLGGNKTIPCIVAETNLKNVLGADLGNL